MTIPLEQRQQAKELFIVEGLTLDQVAEKTGLSMQTVRRWSAEEDWVKKRAEYQAEREVFQVSLANLRTKMLEKALESLDPQMAYAVVAIEKVLNMKKGNEDPPVPGDRDMKKMSKEELMKFLKDKIYGL